MRLHTFAAALALARLANHYAVTQRAMLERRMAHPVVLISAHADVPAAVQAMNVHLGVEESLGLV